jgi:hypothetical protein
MFGALVAAPEKKCAGRRLGCWNAGVHGRRDVGLAKDYSTCTCSGGTIAPMQKIYMMTSIKTIKSPRSKSQLPHLRQYENLLTYHLSNTYKKPLD